jgi:hypothetical protein
VRHARGLQTELGLNINLFTLAPGSSDAPGSFGSRAAPGTVACPSCGGDLAPIETETGWQSCPFCEKRLQVRLWPALLRNANAAVAIQDQATCFFHPDKAFQACCQRCGRFVCALCDLQLGAEHVCPTCFERGRAGSGVDGAKAEWRHRDVLYDSIAVTIGWAWIILWPVIVAALPAVIFLHAKYRRAPRSYLIPRSGWRFWMAYVGLAWLPLLLAVSILIPRWVAGRH